MKGSYIDTKYTENPKSVYFMSKGTLYLKKNIISEKQLHDKVSAFPSDIITIIINHIIEIIPVRTMINFYSPTCME